MGHLHPLAPGLSRYPAATNALDPAERVLIAALRWWVADLRQGSDPLFRLRQAMEAVGAPDAAHSVDALMRVVARTARRPIDVRCPHCARLSPDEQRLLHAASLAQAGETGLAERGLRAGMLSALGAEFAMGPLEGLGELLAGVGLRLRRRFPPADDPALPGAEAEAWLPPATLH